MKKTLLALLAAAALAAPLAAQSAGTTLDRIKAAKAINIAYSPDSLPFSFTESNGEPMGYTIDLCKRVVTQVARTVGVPNLKVNWIAAATPQRLQMIASGKADLDCANTTQTLGRLAGVDFSGLIFLEMGGLLGRSDAKLQQLSDLGGRKIVVLKGTTTEQSLRQVLQKKLVNAEVVTVEKAGDGIALLEAGGADAYAGDRIKLLGLVTQAKDAAKFAFISGDFSYEPYALALPRNDSAFRLEVNRALSQVYRSGEIVTIYTQWLGALGQPPELITAMYALSIIPE
jgi:ABC-type amino acid transport substrate-binding protein